MIKATNLIQTGIAWIPEIPSDWELKRIKLLFDFNKNIVGKTSADYDVLSLTTKGVIKRDLESGMGKFPASFDGYQIVKPNSIMLCLFDMDVTPRVVGHVDDDGIISAAYTNIIPKKGINSKYYYYYFLLQDKNKSLLALGTGIRITLNKDFFGTLKIPVPPIEVQNGIVAYLDKKNNEIDKFIRNKERLVELLEERKKKVISKNISQWIHSELKESGISWIGKIPTHWSVLNLKYLLKSKLKYGANEEAKDANPEHPRYIRITDFGFDGKLSDDTFRSLPLKKAKDYLLNEGDILFARSGATVGKTFQFKEYNGLACFAGYLIKASPNAQKILSDFLYLYTQSSLFEEWKNGIFDKATIENIGADKYAVLKVIVPPVEEQEQIIAFVQNESSEINLAISKAQKEVSSIKEYREALITDLVTGKRSVPQIQKR
jgi:type I restriction enzyme S subunit